MYHSHDPELNISPVNIVSDKAKHSEEASGKNVLYTSYYSLLTPKESVFRIPKPGIKV